MKRVLSTLTSANLQRIWSVAVLPAFLLLTACDSRTNEGSSTAQTATTNDTITINVPRIDMDQARRSLTNAGEEIKEAAGTAAVEARRLGDRIRSELKSDQAISESAEDVTIQVNKDIVIITGTVKSERDRQLITEKVKNLAGERRVDNQLTVKTE